MRHVPPFSISERAAGVPVDVKKEVLGFRVYDVGVQGSCNVVIKNCSADQEGIDICRHHRQTLTKQLSEINAEVCGAQDCTALNQVECQCLALARGSVLSSDFAPGVCEAELRYERHEHGIVVTLQ